MKPVAGAPNPKALGPAFPAELPNVAGAPNGEGEDVVASAGFACSAFPPNRDDVAPPAPPNADVVVDVAGLLPKIEDDEAPAPNGDPCGVVDVPSAGFPKIEGPPNAEGFAAKGL